MDSGNSSSVQSSSGGDEEGESISTFLAPHTTLIPHHPSHLPTTSSPRRRHALPPHSSFFDPLSSYLDAFTRSPPLPPAATSDPLLNLDMSWTGSLRTLGHPNCTDVDSGLLGSALPPRDSPAAAPGRGVCTGTTSINPSPSPSSSQMQHPPLLPPSETLPNAAAAPPRNSRKRSRASRRAPTTVLTTDTSNFRAMVQEFTGIPSPPFPSTPLFPPRSRLDLFHAAGPSAVRSPSALGGAPHSLLRPFAQKVPIPSFGPFAPGSSSSSSSVPAIAAVVSAAATTGGTNADGSIVRAFATNSGVASAPSTSLSANTASMASTYQPPSLGDQHQNLLNMFSFQSLQSTPTTRYDSLDVAMLGVARSAQGVSRMMPPMVDYAAGGRLGPTSDGTPSSRGGGSGGDDLLQWVEGSGGSEGGG